MRWKAKDLTGIDAVIHLAALSNDPLGELAPGLTEEINFGGTIRLAKLAKRGNQALCIFLFSKHVWYFRYRELEEDKSQKNAITHSYARTKWEAECALNALHDNDFTVVCFRPSTVFGARVLGYVMISFSITL